MIEIIVIGFVLLFIAVLTLNNFKPLHKFFIFLIILVFVFIISNGIGLFSENAIVFLALFLVYAITSYFFLHRKTLSDEPIGKHIRNQLDIFVKSFKNPHKFIHVSAIDLVTLFIFLIILTGFFQAMTLSLNPIANQLPLINTKLEAALSSGSITEKQALASQIMDDKTELFNSIGFMLISLFVFLVLIFFTFSVSQGYVWSRIFGDKATYGFIKKFVMYIFILLTGYAVLVILQAMTLTTGVSMLLITIETILFTYIFIVCLSQFDKNASIMLNVRRGFDIAINRFYSFIIPLILIYIMIQSLVMVLFLISLLNIDTIMIIMTFMSIFGLLAWLRYYLYEIVCYTRKKHVQ